MAPRRTATVTLAIGAAVALWLATGRGRPAEADTDVEAKAKAVLEDRCAECHSPRATHPLRRRATAVIPDILKLNDLVAAGEVTPGDLNGSTLWQYVTPQNGRPPEMPHPKSAKPEPLSESALRPISDWILSLGGGHAKVPEGDGAPRSGNPPTAGTEAERAARLKAGDPAVITAILSARCLKCHNDPAKKGGMNTRVRETVVGPTRPIDPSIPVATDQRLWKRITSTEPGFWMPRGEDGSVPGEPPLTKEEREGFRAWIERGAPYTSVAARPFVGAIEILKAIDADLVALAGRDPEAAQSRRYFTIANLHDDDPGVVDDAALAEARAACGKLLNSLSWGPRIVVPQVVPNTNECVLSIDLRQLRDYDGKPWSAGMWRLLLQPWPGLVVSGQLGPAHAYPYGMTWTLDNDPDVRRLAEDIKQRTGESIPAIRVDWFCANASQSPIYESLLGLPRTLQALEERLNLRTQSDLADGTLLRIGRVHSQVAYGQRALDRHESNVTRMYWRSHDFLRGNATGDLVHFPLGPAFHGTPFPQLAFDPDGGEIIFALPNGLHAYYLADKQGNFVAAGNARLVRDASDRFQTVEVVNGISCISCHDQGMKIAFTDFDEPAVGPRESDLFRRLYRDRIAVQAAFDGDLSDYRRAVTASFGPYLRPGSGEVPEPVSEVAARYFEWPTHRRLAAELGITESDLDRQASKLLTILDLKFHRPVGSLDARIQIPSRAFLESVAGGQTLFQQFALSLGQGTPVD